MFKISITDTPYKRTLLVEGKLIPPWTGELPKVWRDASTDLNGRTLAIDLSDVTTINREGEDTLFDLMKEGAKFTCGGVLTKHVLKRLARRGHCKFRDVLLTISARPSRDGEKDVTGD